MKVKKPNFPSQNPKEVLKKMGAKLVKLRKEGDTLTATILRTIKELTGLNMASMKPVVRIFESAHWSK